jgi:hypothetical protein
MTYRLHKSAYVMIYHHESLSSFVAVPKPKGKKFHRGDKDIDEAGPRDRVFKPDGTHLNGCNSSETASTHALCEVTCVHPAWAG